MELIPHNLTELLPSNGRSLRVAGLPLWMILVGFLLSHAVVICRAPERKPAFRVVVIGISLLIAVIVGWYLANLASESSVEKYGKTFSAMQFILGRDRSSDLSNG